MTELRGTSLDDLLDLAVRKRFIDAYHKGTNSVSIFIKGQDHRLNYQQTWEFLSATLYDWVQSSAFETE